MSSDIPKTAAAYAAILGWRLFLTAPDCRVPIKHPSFEHGVHDATGDAEELLRRFGLFPDANVALACGPHSGVLALDVDRKGTVDGFSALAALEAEFGLLPPTVRSSTPSGGAHLLFAFPAGSDPRNRVGLKRYDSAGSRSDYPGLDVRAAGASIALPPSRRAGGAYQWTVAPSETLLAPVPLWLLALMISEPPPRAPAPPVRLANSERAARYVEAAVNRECCALAAMPANSGRNLRLFQASANLGEFVGAGVLPQALAEGALEAAAHDCGLVREDGLCAVRATIRSGMDKGMANPRELAR